VGLNLLVHYNRRSLVQQTNHLLVKQNCAVHLYSILSYISLQSFEQCNRNIVEGISLYICLTLTMKIKYDKMRERCKKERHLLGC
jgi:hypothetical protein